MKQTLILGRIQGFPVGVHWSVLVVMVLLAQGLAIGVLPARVPGLSAPVAWLLGLGGAVLFLLSLFAHELAHALVARHFDIRVERLTLWLLGGMAEFRDEPRSARVDLLVAGVGPVTSLVAGAGFGAAALLLSTLGGPAAIVAVLAWLAMINVVLAGFNLLPGAPLDGGRVLRAALWWWRGDRTRAALTATRVGHALGVTLILVGFGELFIFRLPGGIWTALVGWFLLIAANAEGAAVRLRSVLKDLPIRAVMHTDPVCGATDQSVASFIPVAAGSGQRVFPVRDADGGPAGTVDLAALVHVPASLRPTTTLQQVTRSATLLQAAQPVVDVVPPAPHDWTLLVVDDGRLVGSLSEADIARAVELAQLRSAAGAR